MKDDPNRAQFDNESLDSEYNADKDLSNAQKKKKKNQMEDPNNSMVILRKE